MRPLCRLTQETFQQLLSEARCYALLRQARWPDGAAHCPRCHAPDLAGPWPDWREPACHRYQCLGCGLWFNDRSGTVFARAKLPLSAWFLAIYLVELGQTTAQIARELPCDDHTAHRVVWTVREQELHLEGGRRLSGVIEVDEIYQTAGQKGRAAAAAARELGREPRRRGRKRGRGRGSAAKEAPALLGLASRSGEVVVEVVPDVKQQTLAEVFAARVAPGSTVYSDSASGYEFLAGAGFEHASVNHSAGEYARGAVHENRAENLWSFWPAFLRPFRGVAQRNLPAYARIFQYRRNQFHLGAFGRFRQVLASLLSARSDRGVGMTRASPLPYRQARVRQVLLPIPI